MRTTLLIGLVASLTCIAQGASADTRIGIAVGLPVPTGIHIYDVQSHHSHYREHRHHGHNNRYFSNNWRNRHDYVRGYDRSDRYHSERRYTDRHYYEYDQPRRDSRYYVVPNVRKYPKYCR